MQFACFQSLFELFHRQFQLELMFKSTRNCCFATPPRHMPGHIASKTPRSPMRDVTKTPFSRFLPADCNYLVTLKLMVTHVGS